MAHTLNGEKWNHYFYNEAYLNKFKTIAIQIAISCFILSCMTFGYSIWRTRSLLNQFINECSPFMQRVLEIEKGTEICINQKYQHPYQIHPQLLSYAVLPSVTKGQCTLEAKLSTPSFFNKGKTSKFQLSFSLNQDNQINLASCVTDTKSLHFPSFCSATL